MFISVLLALGASPALSIFHFVIGILSLNVGWYTPRTITDIVNTHDYFELTCSGFVTPLYLGAGSTMVVSIGL